MVGIPFSLLPPKIVRKLAEYVAGLGQKLSLIFPNIQLDLDQANIQVSAREYLAGCVVTSLVNLLFLGFILALLLSKIQLTMLGMAVAFVLALIIFMQQLHYPKLLAYKRIQKLDTEILAALRTFLIQLNSGVSLFDAMVGIGQQQFGEVSIEFNKVVESINGGTPQVEALETMVLKNPSPYFQQAIWQIINGIKAGADITLVMNSVIENLTKEEIIQIEKYGSQLNPLAMFYMIVAVIMPALGVTFLLVIASFIHLSELALKLTLFGLLGTVLFLQVIFMGIIKTKRPSLLGE